MSSPESSTSVAVAMWRADPECSFPADRAGIPSKANGDMQVTMIQERALNIYTDGSSLPTPRRGGFAFRFIYVDDSGNEFIQDVPVYESYPNATNNQMELFAVITAIEEAPSSQYYDQAGKIVVLSDSQYVTSNYTHAMFNWPKSKWRTKAGNPVANAELWKRLIRLIKNSPKKIEIIWVKGHSRDHNNRYVDKLAKQSARSPLRTKPLTVVNVRRKLSDRGTELGSVQMRGQKIEIRIVTEEYLKVQRTHKYRYEVMSKRSRFFRCVDVAYSDLLLKAGHHYVVTFNKDSSRPRILRLVEEVTIS